MSDQRKHTVLLVDDEPEILYSLRGLLRREFELFTAQSGAEALRIFDEHDIHVIMTDQRMPELTGVELIRRVRKHHPDAIPIIFTGYADLKAVVDAINAGGLFRYVTKPWDPDELIQTLHEAAREYERRIQQRLIVEDMQRFLGELKETFRSMVDPPPPFMQAAEKTEQLLERLEQL